MQTQRVWSNICSCQPSVATLGFIIDENVFNLTNRAEIHQALLSQFSLLAELFIGKLAVKDYDSRVLELVNLNPDILHPHNLCHPHTL
jgi:hypothetical protein